MLSNPPRGSWRSPVAEHTALCLWAMALLLSPGGALAQEPTGGIGIVAGGKTTQEESGADALSVMTDQGLDAVFVRVPSGLGAMACGKARYSVDSTNPRLRAAAQRAGAMRALIDAKKKLAAMLHGEKIKANVEVVRKSLSVDTEAASHAGTQTGTTESLESVVQGWLRGVVVHQMNDDIDKGECRISVITTPATMGAFTRMGVGSSATIDVGMGELKAALFSGVLPPAGCRVVRVGKNGTRLYMGYSTLSAVDAENDMRFKHAEGMASAALLATLKGESLASHLRSTDAFRQAASDLSDEDIALAGGDEFKAPAVGQASIFSSREGISLSSEGTLPRGTLPDKWRREGSQWVHVVRYWAEGGVALVAPISPAPVKAETPQPAESGGAAAAEALPGAPAAPAGFATSPSAALRRTPDGTAYLVISKGTASARAVALSQAVLEALRMVNGSEISHTQSSSNIFMDAVADVQVDLGVASAQKSLEASLETTTAEEQVKQVTRGLVRNYRVLQEGIEDGLHAVVIEATIPIFDPRNPRPGKRRTVVVLPFSSASVSFAFGEGQVSAAELDRAVTHNLITLLVDKGTYSVLDRAHLALVNKEANRIKELAASGRMSAEEALRLGHTMGADILITGHIENYAVGKIAKVIELTNEKIVRWNLEFAVQVTAINVATEETMGSTVCRINLNDAQAREKNLRSAQQMHDYAVATAGTQIMDEIGGKLSAEMRRKRAEILHEDPAVVRKVDGVLIVLTAPVGVLTKGDLLSVGREEQIPDGQGGTASLRTDLAVLEVVKVQGILVQCRIRGDAAAPLREGDTAELTKEASK